MAFSGYINFNATQDLIFIWSLEKGQATNISTGKYCQKINKSFGFFGKVRLNLDSWFITEVSDNVNSFLK